MQCSACGAQVRDDARFCGSCGNLQAAGRSQVPGSPSTGGTAVEPYTAVGYGGFWKRVVATMIDSIVIQAGFVLLLIPMSFAMGASFFVDPGDLATQMSFTLIFMCVAFGGNWLYSAMMESSAWQATLGKKALGLKVTDEQGGRMSFGRATGRYFSKLLSGMTLGIGYLMVAFTDRKRGLHDMIANTLVVQTR